MINNMKINDLTTLRVFKTIFETRSLTSAAKQMGLSKPALSKRLDGLELDLGFKLFSRTTRSIVPTQKANSLILQVSEILNRIDNLNQDLSIEVGASKAKIKVTCNTSMSHGFIGRILKEYQKIHPGLEIELLVTDSVLDPIEHNIDLAIRVNPSRNSSMVGKKVGDYKLVVVASPEYLKKHKRIKKAEDLVSHDLLIIEPHMRALNHLPKDLSRRLNGRRSFITNDSPLVSQLVLNENGVGVRASWDVKIHLKNKKLVLVLPENNIPVQGDVWLVSTKERLGIEVVRKLFDHLQTEMAYFLE